MDPVGLLMQTGGIADAALLRANVGRKGIRRALKRGALVHVARNRYSLPITDDALALARSVNGYLILESAALHWGWEVRMPPDVPQVTVPRGKRSTAEGAVRIDVQREDVDGWATNRLQTALMCAAHLDFADALAVVDSALRHRDVTEAALARGAAAIPGERGKRARRVVAYADGSAANPFESALRGCAIAAGVEVVPQFRMLVGDLAFHPDLANPILGIALEAESWEFHGKDRRDFDRDCARYTAMTATGWRVLRFTWKEVMFEQERVTAVIRATADLARSCAC